LRRLTTPPEDGICFDMISVTIQELRGTTDEIVRRAGAADVPTYVTDKGRPIAVITNVETVFNRPRKRVLTPAFEAHMQKPYRGNLQEDLAEVRGER
jgi:prevent-host-death family protein